MERLGKSLGVREKIDAGQEAGRQARHKEGLARWEADRLSREKIEAQKAEATAGSAVGKAAETRRVAAEKAKTAAVAAKDTARKDKLDREYQRLRGDRDKLVARIEKLEDTVAKPGSTTADKAHLAAARKKLAEFDKGKTLDKAYEALQGFTPTATGEPGAEGAPEAPAAAQAGPAPEAPAGSAATTRDVPAWDRRKILKDRNLDHLSIYGDDDTLSYGNPRSQRSIDAGIAFARSKGIPLTTDNPKAQEVLDDYYKRHPEAQAGGEATAADVPEFETSAEAISAIKTGQFDIDAPGSEEAFLALPPQVQEEVRAWLKRSGYLD